MNQAEVSVRAAKQMLDEYPTATESTRVLIRELARDIDVSAFLDQVIECPHCPTCSEAAKNTLRLIGIIKNAAQN